MKAFWLVAGVTLLCGLSNAHAQTTPSAPPQEQPTAKPPIELETRSYIRGMTLLAQHYPNTDRYGKIQMMSVGERRYLFQAYSTESDETVGAITDVTDPLHPILIKDRAWTGGFQNQLAYNSDLRKWILIVGQSEHSPSEEGLRGIEIYDASDPANLVLMSRWSVDGGDPARRLQTGLGTHRFWYDGGKYVYLSAAPDNNFYFPEYKGARTAWGYSFALQIVDVSDPAHPSLVTNWHIPGQRYDELEAREAWPFADDPTPKPFQHGPVYLPRRVEDGGTIGYGSWGAFGMVIQDFSDVAHPKVISTWRPSPSLGPQIPVHTVDIARLNRGFVITNPEAIAPHCAETMTPTSIVDVRDPSNPTLIANLPIPTPPEDAPYPSFCERYGRFGPHNPPHLKAPGTPDPNFTCYAYFNAGLQCFDITDPRRPFINGYFVPRQGPEGAHAIANPPSNGHWIRTVDNVFIEWDRKLIWAAADSGLYLLSSEALGEPVLTAMPVDHWALDGLNADAP